MIKKLLLIMAAIVYFWQLLLPVQVFALSNQANSDPSGKSQRYVIEKTPWYDPTACAAPVSSAGSISVAKGSTYVIGDSITQNTGVQSALKTALEGAGYTPVTFNSLSSRSLTTGSSGINGITVFQNDVSSWKSVNNIIIELGTNGGVNDANVQTMIKLIKDNNPNANLFWINVGAANSKRTSTPIDTAGINTILTNNASLGYKVIDWKSVVDSNPDYISNDGLGVHPFTKEGSQAYADTVIKAMGSSQGSTAGGLVQSGCYCPTGVVNNGFNGSNNVEIAFNFFNGRQGITAIQAAAIVGNFMQESGPTLNTGALSNDGHSSFGIAQWTGGRKTNLINYAKSVNKEPNDLTAQLEFVMVELNGGYNKFFQDFLKTTTVETATKLWSDKYESPAAWAANIPNRTKYANDVLRLYGGNAAIIANVVNNDCQNNPGAIGQAPNGFVFPLITTKTAIKKGNDQGFKWCYSSATSCHHDYPAADIGVNTGTIVVAAIGGTVVAADPNCPKDCSITIKGTDQNVYYYDHMGAGTITVRKGDKVNPGQPMGKVGTAADGGGSTPHLHLNIMNSKWNTMPTCFNSNCPNKADMIDPQPWLLEAFKYLPE